MAIYVPGKRDRHNRPMRNNKRSVVAILSLTAMVDMFTVLVVFLLQNYQTTGEVLDIHEKVVLPKAMAVKELRPAHVVIVTKDQILLDKVPVASFKDVAAQDDWTITALDTQLKQRFAEAEQAGAVVGLSQIKKAVDQTKPPELQDKPEDRRRVTVQADKNIDFLTIKKVMYTLTEAGATEINFAVMKEEKHSTN